MLIQAIREATHLVEKWHSRNYFMTKGQLFEFFYIKHHFADSSEKLDKLYKIKNFFDLIPKGLFLDIKNNGNQFLEELYKQAEAKLNQNKEVDFYELNNILGKLNKCVDAWIELNSKCDNKLNIPWM